MKMDEYELDLLDAIETADEFDRVENFEDELLEAKMAANNFLKKTKNVNIRIPEFDMLMLKRRSAELNIPYQTILSSLIHQYVTQKVKLSF
ncbi:MAG: antitoxin [Campylobacterota bacterium]|nr:antitoxin [Campylobacterota bacterium]